MPLTPGQDLLHYRLVEKIGEGGMGVVWRARDTKLERDVALKVLPAAFRQDATRVARLEREARVLASMNHSNIAAIYGLEQDGDVRFLVLEFIAGESLAHTIARGPLPVGQTLKIARQIARALAGAHGRGIVHRDLKPANVMVTPEGRVEVLDFGLAKEFVTQGPTVSSGEMLTATKGATGEGIIRGTVPYMSPEQARGNAVDGRTDVWAFGCVVYEMLTGKRAFHGETVTDILAAIVHEEPDWQRLPSDLPETLRVSLQRCLEKDVDARLQDIREFAPVARGLAGNLVGQPVRSVRTLALGALGILAVVAVTLLFVVLLRGRGIPSARAAPEKAMLVVLPFANLSADPEREFFSDGVTEEVTARLAGLDPARLGVIARTSAMHYKNTDTSIDRIGEELGVGYVLEGSVRHAGDRVRITAQLIVVEDQTHLWAETYERDATDIFGIQGEVAARVARSLSVELLPEQRERLSRAETSNPAAHEAYLRGRFHWNKRTVPDLERAIDYFDRAVELDPGYAEAYAGLAEAWVLLPDYSEFPASESNVHVRAAARKALALDPTLIAARAPLAKAAMYEWDWPTAEAEILRVLEHDPGYATARQWYAWLLIMLDRDDEALEQIRRARELDPLSLIINSNVGQMLYMAGRPGEALRELDRCLVMDPAFPRALRFRAQALGELGREREAAEILGAMLEHERDAWVLADLAVVEARLGRTEDAGRLLVELESMYPAESNSLILAGVLAALDRTDDALAALERGCKRREPSMRHLLTFRPLESLEAEPRFRDVMRCVNLAG